MTSLPSTFKSLSLALSNGRLVWPVYTGLVCLLSALCFGSLKDHLLDVHDYETFQDNVAIGEDFTFFFSPEKQQPTGRPAADLVKFLAYLIAGNDPGFFHLLVVAFHALATILLARLAWGLGTSLPLSLTGGLLFLVNVAHFQAVHHISALDYPLALVFGLGTLLCYLKYLPARRWPWLCAFYGGSVICVMALAAMAFLWPFCLYWGWCKGYDLKTTLRHLLPLLCLITVELVFIVAITPGETNAGRAIGLYSENDPILLLAGMGRLLLWALSRLITTAHWLPFPIYEFHSWELYSGAGILVALLLVIHGKRFPGSLWSIWVFLSLLPFLPLTFESIIGRPAGPSRYLYLATAGSSLLFAWVIEETTLRIRSLGRWFHGGILVALFVSSYFFLKQTEALSFYSSGRNYIARGEIEPGINQLERAILRGPGTIDLQDTYARLLLMTMGMGPSDLGATLKEAISAFPASTTLNIYKLVVHSISQDSSISRHAEEQLDAFKTSNLKLEIEVQPGRTIEIENKEHIKEARIAISRAYYNIGNGYWGQKDPQRAIFAYRRSLEFDPGRINSIQNLVGALYASGLVAEAAHIALEAVEGNPSPPNGLLVNASLALESSGKVEKAIAICQQIFSRDPSPSQSKAVFLLYRRILESRPGGVSSPIYAQMGLDLWKGGITDDSITAFRIALEKDQTNSRAHFGLGLACLAEGKIEEAESIYAQGLTTFGLAAAVEAGAPEGIRALLAQGIQVMAARDILATYFPQP